ncbi:Hypothetical predicted protein, partial [Podarcis lilfordi]
MCDWPSWAAGEYRLASRVAAAAGDRRVPPRWIFAAALLLLSLSQLTIILK